MITYSLVFFSDCMVLDNCKIATMEDTVVKTVEKLVKKSREEKLREGKIETDVSACEKCACGNYCNVFKINLIFLDP